MACEAKLTKFHDFDPKAEDGKGSTFCKGLYCKKCERALFGTWRPFGCPERKPSHEQG